MADRIAVLIVDDIQETRDHLTKLLGFESDIEVVGAAASGPEALELAQRLHPAIVLMDINMPGMDGIATTEQMAAVEPSASVIMMSVQGEADYLRRSMLAGAREFLVKPFSSDELVSSIRQVQRPREGQGDPSGRTAGRCRQRDGPGARPDRHRLLTQGRRGTDHRGRQPRRRRRLRDGQEGGPRGRQLPVRGRRRPAQPQSQEQVHRRPHPGHGRRRSRDDRPGPGDPRLGPAGHAGPAKPRDVRTHHHGLPAPRARALARHARPGHRGLAGRGSTTRPWASWISPTRSWPC